jgi:tripartite-type tricarboxylate transporter receptor subunit TctC
VVTGAGGGIRRVCTTLLLVLCAVQSGFAQDYPRRAVRLVVTSAAGSGIDIAARLLGQHLAESWGQPVVVDNRVGASGQIGGAMVARASPDGYTLLVVSPVFVIGEALYPKLPYSFRTDFAPVARIGKTPYLMAVSPSVPAKSIADFISYAKTRPGEIHYGSNGTGTIMHLAGELFKTAAGVDLVHVPYKASTQVMTDVIAGRVETMFNSVTLLAPGVRSGKLRALGIASAERSALLPDVRTFAESGYPTIQVESWYGLVAPAKTPQSVLAILQRYVVAAAKSQAVRERLIAMGTEPLTENAEQFRAVISDEIDRYARVIKSAGVTVD